MGELLTNKNTLTASFFHGAVVKIIHCFILLNDLLLLGLVPSNEELMG